MKRKFILLLLTTFLTISFMSLVGCNNQNPTKEKSSISKTTSKKDYDLQERCGKRCEEWFKKEYNGMNCSYRNHYNNKLNKCLIRVSCISSNFSNEILFDVNENNKLGGLSDFKNGKVFCSMSDKECKSVSEWEILVKPYMEE